MPVFNLPKSNRLITERLTGIMLFPHAPAKRRALSHSFMLTHANRVLQHGYGKIVDEVLYAEHLKKYVPPQELIEHAAKEIGDAPSLAGAMLLLTVGTERRVASLNLSNLALDQAYKCKKQTSKRRLEYLWPKYQSVAHFWAAHQIWITPDAIPNTKVLEGFPCHPSQVMLFLAFAEYLRRKGEDFSSPRSKKEVHLLDRNRTWRVSPASRVARLSDEDFRFDSMYKFLDTVLKERKRYGLK